MSSLDGMKKDQKTVDAQGKNLSPLPYGSQLRELVTHVDDRGSVFEMWADRWEFHPHPIVFVYTFTVRPGIVKGWGMHKLHDDRYCIQFGELEVVLYDGRTDSPTFGLVSRIFLSEYRRQLLSIPAGVWHADHNIGSKDAVVVNFPTIQYDYESPDKYRLPVDTDQIPFKFDNPKGG